MSKQRLFAGFWRDGAVVVPSEKHYVNDRCVFAVHKKDGALDLCTETYEYWHKVFWLDTTTPTELTPEEAFELLRVISPATVRMKSKHNAEWLAAEPFKPIINWGTLTEYPPLQKWRVPIDADKGKKCRCKNTRSQKDWTDGYIFLVTDGDIFVVKHQGGYLVTVEACEVLE
jgi:hypothetical protein